MTTMRKRFPFTDAATAATLTSKVGTHGAHALHNMVAADPPVTLGQLNVLFILANLIDLHEAAGDVDPAIHVEDVADYLGQTSTWTGRFLRQLARANYVRGSAAAGYRLSGRFAWKS